MASQRSSASQSTSNCCGSRLRLLLFENRLFDCVNIISVCNIRYHFSITRRNNLFYLLIFIVQITLLNITYSKALLIKGNFVSFSWCVNN